MSTLSKMQQRLLLLSLLLYPLALGLSNSVALVTTTDNLDHRDGLVSSTSAPEATIEIQERDPSYSGSLSGFALSPTPGPRPPAINGSTMCRLAKPRYAMQTGHYADRQSCNSSHPPMSSTSVSSHGLPSLTFNHSPTPSPPEPSLVPYTGTGPSVDPPSSAIAMIALMGIHMWLV